MEIASAALRDAVFLVFLVSTTCGRVHTYVLFIILCPRRVRQRTENVPCARTSDTQTASSIVVGKPDSLATGGVQKLIDDIERRKSRKHAQRSCLDPNYDDHIKVRVVFGTCLHVASGRNSGEASGTPVLAAHSVSAVSDG